MTPLSYPTQTTVASLPGRPALSSFSSVFLGALIAAAIAIAFASLSVALGFGAIDAYSDNPLAGVGTALGIPSVIGLALGLAIGAFVTGRFAGACGYSHGLATWATFLMLAALASSMAVSGAVRATGEAAGTILTTAGSAVGGVAQGAGSALGGISSLNGDLLGNVDWKQTSDQIKQTLRNTQIDGLQPDQFEQSFQAAAQDIKDAVRSIAINPAKTDEILTSLGDKLSEQVKAKTANFNRDDAITALVNNGMDRPSAEQAVDNAKRLVDQTGQAVDQGIERAKQTIAEIKQASEDLKNKAQEAAAQAAAATSKAAWWAFIAAIIGAIVASFAAEAGVKSREKYVPIV